VTLTIDAHVHVVSDDLARYPLNPAGLPGAWYREAPVSTEELLALMAAAGVDRAVLVQPMGAYRYDNRYAVESSARYPRQLATVCIVDMDGEQPARSLRQWVHEGGAGGVRLFGIPDAAWLDDPRTFPVWEEAARLNVPVVVTILRHEIPRLLAVVGRFPAVKVALDHCGFPDLSGGPPYSAARDLFALADFPNLYLKWSTPVLDAAAMHGDPRDLIGHLVERFGPQRLIWGSDYSQTHDRTYAELVGLARVAVSRLSQHDQRWCLGEAALDLWPQLRA
jgi:predicted TIM-barrel fold metal-dependent hydrolase